MSRFSDELAGLKKRATYMELIEELNEEKIDHYPNRQATLLENSVYMSQIGRAFEGMAEENDRIMKQKLKESLISEAASASGRPAHQVRLDSQSMHSVNSVKSESIAGTNLSEFTPRASSTEQVFRRPLFLDGISDRVAETPRSTATQPGDTLMNRMGDIILDERGMEYRNYHFRGVNSTVTPAIVVDNRLFGPSSPNSYQSMTIDDYDRAVFGLLEPTHLRRLTDHRRQLFGPARPRRAIMDRLAEYTRLPAVNFLPSTRMLGQAFSLGRNAFSRFNIADRQVDDEALALQDVADSEMLESIYQQEAREDAFIQAARQQIAPIEPLRIVDAPRGSIDTTSLEPVRTLVERIEESSSSSSKKVIKPGKTRTNKPGAGAPTLMERQMKGFVKLPEQEVTRSYLGMFNSGNAPDINDGVVHFEKAENYGLDRKYKRKDLENQLRNRGYSDAEIRKLRYMSDLIDVLKKGDITYFNKKKKSK